MPSTSDPMAQARLEEEVGNPYLKLAALREHIQTVNIRRFKDVEPDVLDLLWTIDSYRVRQVVPRQLGSISRTMNEGGEGLYRAKGNHFSEVISLILSNKTSSKLASRSNVQGFSQTHQIDIAWPARATPGTALQDPLICCEVKLTGAPGFASTPARSGRADWSNRRKELKFQATDLKLYRHQASTSIHHWDQWRRKAPPLVYVLWAARLTGAEEFGKMVKDAKALTDTYLDGVGIYGFLENLSGDGYVPAKVSPGVSERVTSLDNVLDLIAAEIASIMEAHDNRVPAPVLPRTTLDEDTLRLSEQ